MGCRWQKSRYAYLEHVSGFRPLLLYGRGGLVQQGALLPQLLLLIVQAGLALSQLPLMCCQSLSLPFHCMHTQRLNVSWRV